MINAGPGSTAYDQPTAAGGGADLLGEAFEANTPIVEALDGLDEMAKGSTEPIQPPDHERIPLTEIGQGISQSWPAGTARLFTKAGPEELRDFSLTSIINRCRIRDTAT